MLASLLLAGDATTLKRVDLTLSDLEGVRVHVRDLRGQIVVLNFWATWCGPCKAELPLLAAQATEYKAKGVTFVAVSLDESKNRSKVQEFAKKLALPFPVWTGASGDDLDKLGLGEIVPATAFLDKEGRIVARVSGQIQEFDIRERLDWLLNGQTSPAPKPFIRHL